MFGKLKEKLKSALTIFSKKAEEEAEVKPVVEEKTVALPPEKKEEKKVAPIPEKKEIYEKKREIKPVPISEKDREEAKKLVEKAKQEAAKEELERQKKEILAKYGPKEEKKEIRKEEPKKEEIKKKEEVKIEIKEEKKVEVKKREEEKVEPKIIEEKILPQEQPAKELEAKEEPVEEKKSFFGKIKEALTTKTISSEKFKELFWELELTLLENNVSVEVIEKIKEDLEKELVDKPLPRDVEGKIEETLRKTFTEILTFEKINILKKIKEKTATEKPYVIAFFGINGAGKTTSIAKFTHYLQKNKISVILAACDTFRAAAIQQLEEHADKLGVKMIKHDYGSDAAAVAFDAIKYAEKNKIEVVLIDTAGRQHSNANLMAELEKIIRVTEPDLKLFVGESITGNDCVEQAREFNELVELDGTILTKVDVDEKGGAPLSIAYTIKKPILFLGTGQKYDDFEEFSVPKILDNLGF